MKLLTQASGVPTNHSKFSTLEDLTQMAPLGYEEYSIFKISLYLCAKSNWIFMYLLTEAPE